MRYNLGIFSIEEFAMKPRLLFVTLIVLLLAACAPKPTNPQAVIETSPGREFKVVIDSNPSTGYQWEIVGELDGKVVELVGKEYQSTSQPGLVGGGGIDIWTFKAVGPGETTITLGSYPPSNDATQPSQTETFTVRVK
jgi:predicted secreted protein